MTDVHNTTGPAPVAAPATPAPAAPVAAPATPAPAAPVVAAPVKKEPIKTSPRIQAPGVVTADLHSLVQNQNVSAAEAAEHDKKQAALDNLSPTTRMEMAAGKAALDAHAGIAPPPKAVAVNPVVARPQA